MRPRPTALTGAQALEEGGLAGQSPLQRSIRHRASSCHGTACRAPGHSWTPRSYPQEVPWGGNMGPLCI